MRTIPLQIVRNDITKTLADAVVNSTNEYLVCGGHGVDASIHAAAGKELKTELSKIGYCPVGKVVVTDSFNLQSCRHIIHAVSPVYEDGRHGEEEALKDCYNSIFAAAVEYGCKSLAMPVLCSGANGYPKKEAYDIAAGCARRFLSEYDGELMIYLVIFSNSMMKISEEADGKVAEFITEDYRAMNRELLNTLGVSERPRPGRGVESRGGRSCNRPCSDQRELSEQAGYREQDSAFGAMCRWWIQKKEIKMHDFYSRSNLSKGAFHNICSHPEQTPKKTTAFACIFGLRLTLDEAEDLLARAGMVLSPYYETDRIVRKYLEEGNYDIDEVNYELFEKDQTCLGSSMI